MPLDRDIVRSPALRRLCHAIDEIDGPAYSRRFTPEVPSRPAGPPSSGTGPGSLPEACDWGCVTPCSTSIDGDGDEALGRAYFVAYSVAERPPTLLVTGMYRDTLTHASGTWLFAERQFIPDA
jgi:hypothetical protein